MKWPQITMAILLLINVWLGFDGDLCVYHTAAEKYLDAIATSLLLFIILYIGGFWRPRNITITITDSTVQETK